MISAKNKAFSRIKIVAKNEPLANACLNWPLMLYCGGTLLNGELSPSGIESAILIGYGDLLAFLNGELSPSGIERICRKIARGKYTPF